MFSAADGNRPKLEATKLMEAGALCWPLNASTTLALPRGRLAGTYASMSNGDADTIGRATGEPVAGCTVSESVDESRCGGRLRSTRIRESTAIAGFGDAARLAALRTEICIGCWAKAAAIEKKRIGTRRK